MNFKIRDVDYILNKDSNINIPIFDWFINIFPSGNWEPDTFEVFENCSDSQSTALDIGAWIGPTTIFLSKKFKKVISVEADSNAVISLKNNIKDNNCVNVDVIEKALYNNTSKKIFFGQNENNSDGLGDSMSQSRVTPINENDYYIDTITFREIITNYSQDKISFVKIDIEGGEENILNDLFIYGNLYGWKVWISFHYSWWKNKDTDRFLKYLPLIKKVSINNTEINNTDLFDYVHNNHFGSFYLEF